jgi:hypothetical protein
MLFQSIAMVIRQIFVTYSLLTGNATDKSLTSFTLMIDQPMLLLWVTGTCRSPETGLGIELEVLMKELKFFCKKENKKNI